MAFMISTRALSIAKPISSFDNHGAPNKRGRFGRLHMSAQPTLEVGVQVILLKGNKVLMGRRHTVVGDAHFALPGGHLEFGESFEECAYREVKEETGLEIKGAEKLTIVSNAILEPKPMQLVAVIMRAALADPNQEAINMEPEKCDGWNWYHWDHLPSPLLPTLQTAIVEGLNPFPPTTH
ncbi:geranyl diphosphate phosphohydrolase-like [Salvia hispanica]|uniref:geranyl diphosphate phosphohydrolase-like n=1 Tax=Salvia hispanica TaxID=49212 RepID=UPI0020093B44|nr:geranyl diphosphate phosphohydrolase-like [Salvia hispanica]